mgnify:CR=1 FL=1
MNTYNPEVFETDVCKAHAIEQNMTAALRQLIVRNVYSEILDIFIDADLNGDEEFLASLRAKYQQAYSALLKSGEVQPSKIRTYSAKSGTLEPVKFRQSKKKASVVSVSYKSLINTIKTLGPAEQKMVAEYVKSLKEAS